MTTSETSQSRTSDNFARSLVGSFDKGRTKYPHPFTDGLVYGFEVAIQFGNVEADECALRLAPTCRDHGRHTVGV